MTADEIQEYREKIGKKEKNHLGYEQDAMVTLHGYTSTSLQKSIALNFAWEEPKTGHQKVLFHIKWLDVFSAYFLDAGAFDHEEEVLISDGAKLLVESVEEIKNDK